VAGYQLKDKFGLFIDTFAGDLCPGTQHIGFCAYLDQSLGCSGFA